MKYDHILPARFIERPNRFIAFADLSGTTVTCHVKNTGRCRELLVPEAEIYIQHHPDAARSKRKTEYSVIGVKKETDYGSLIINMDSQAPNQAAYEWLCRHNITPDREVRFGNSRFDLAFKHQNTPVFMEVKGVTLEDHGIARFPDAPTERGVKHLKELETAVQEGYGACILFVIAMKGIRSFEANTSTHPEFSQALTHAAAHGVRLLAYDCLTTPDSLTIDKPVPITLF